MVFSIPVSPSVQFNGVSSNSTTPSSLSALSSEFVETFFPEDQLVCMEYPVAVSDERKTKKFHQALTTELRQMIPSGMILEDTLPDAQGPQTNDGTTPGLCDILNELVPPLKAQDNDGVEWTAHVSMRRLNVFEILQIQEKLHSLLTSRNVQQVGICPVRRSLYDAFLVELTRQVLIEHREHGLLLMKLRTERNATLEAHRKRYESMLAYAARWGLRNERESDRLREDIDRLKLRRTQLLAEEEELRRKCEEALELAEDQRHEDEKRNKEEIAALVKEGVQKRTQLELLTAPIKK